MITTVLTQNVRNNLILSTLGSGYSAANPNYIQWGTGSAPALPTDDTICEPIGGRIPLNASITTTTSSGDTLFLQGLLTASGSYSITNLGIFNNQFSTVTGVLSTQLNPGINSTIVNVSGYSNFPAIFPFDIQILSEIMTVITGTGTSWTVIRATNGSPLSTNVIPAGTRVVGGSNTANGSMFLKTSFSNGLNLNQGDALQFKISLQFI